MPSAYLIWNCYHHLAHYIDPCRDLRQSHSRKPTVSNKCMVAGNYHLWKRSGLCSRIYYCCLVSWVLQCVLYKHESRILVTVTKLRENS
jgi:hypothetical protein